MPSTITRSIRLKRRRWLEMWLQAACPSSSTLSIQVWLSMATSSFSTRLTWQGSKLMSASRSWNCSRGPTTKNLARCSQTPSPLCRLCDQSHQRTAFPKGAPASYARLSLLRLPIRLKWRLLWSLARHSSWSDQISLMSFKVTLKRTF